MDQEPTTLGYLLLFVMCVVLAFVTFFFNAPWSTVRTSGCQRAAARR